LSGSRLLGFRRLLLGGQEKVSLEGTLVNNYSNLKRIFNFGVKLRTA
jgi:hypothetical protein